MLFRSAYCRVSTKEELQQLSLQAQQKHYEKWVMENKDYILVGMYVDIASGLKKKGRVQFEKMLKDCKRKRVDLIVTKSISRFARNTLDFLKAIRKLKSIGVDIYFESEHIWLSKERSEMNMAIIAAIAQEESVAKSQNIKWGLVYGFASGTSKMANRVCYGYRNDEAGNLVIDSETAKNVKLIFDLYLQGYSLNKIAKELKNRDILSPTGKEEWTSTAIDKLLTNEKYIGNVMLQKTYIPDVNQTQKKNDGMLPRYLYENNHIGIIPIEIFNAVQEERKKRSNVEVDSYGNTTRRATRYSDSDTLSGKIICGECGRNFRRITMHSGEIVWKCASRVEKGNTCNSQTIKQSEIDKALRERFGDDIELAEMYKKVKSIVVIDKLLDISVQENV